VRSDVWQQIPLGDGTVDLALSVFAPSFWDDPGSQVSGAAGVILLIVGIGVVVFAADVFVDGLLGVALALGIAPFVLSVFLSGFETENLAVGIAANAKGLPGAAAGTFLGGVTFLAFGVAGLGGLIAPNRAEPRRAADALRGLDGDLAAAALCGRDRRAHLTRRGRAARCLVGGGPGRAGTLRTRVARRRRRGRARPPARRAALLVGLALLTGGGWVIGQGLRTTVRQFGVPQTLLGNTALAATVEAEELARFAVPARRGRPEIGLGSIAGTVVHFAALNAGIIALVKPLTLGSQTTGFYLPVAVAAPAIFAAVLVIRKQLGRVEGAALTSLYIAYVAAAIAVST
jgi:cation:H+ antiporter